MICSYPTFSKMSLRKKSSDSTLHRVSLPQEDRETLLPCPACAGAQTTLEEMPDGRYHMKQCPWCQGVGSVPSYIYQAFLRWLRIYNHNRLHGKCGEKK
jgi:hypothetical protein